MTDRLTILPARSSSNGDLVPLDEAEQRVRLHAQTEVIAVGADIARLLVHAARFAIDIDAAREQSARADEECARTIQKLEADTAAQIRILAARLSEKKERTEQIRIIADAIGQAGPAVHPSIAEGLALALAQLTRAL